MRDASAGYSNMTLPVLKMRRRLADRSDLEAASEASEAWLRGRRSSLGKETSVKGYPCFPCLACSSFAPRPPPASPIIIPLVAHPRLRILLIPHFPPLVLLLSCPSPPPPPLPSCGLRWSRTSESSACVVALDPGTARATQASTGEAVTEATHAPRHARAPRRHLPTSSCSYACMPACM